MYGTANVLVPYSLTVFPEALSRQSMDIQSSVNKAELGNELTHKDDMFFSRVESDSAKSVPTRCTGGGGLQSIWVSSETCEHAVSSTTSLLLVVLIPARSTFKFRVLSSKPVHSYRGPRVSFHRGAHVDLHGAKLRVSAACLWRKQFTVAPVTQPSTVAGSAKISIHNAPRFSGSCSKRSQNSGTNMA